MIGGKSFLLPKHKKKLHRFVAQVAFSCSCLWSGFGFFERNNASCHRYNGFLNRNGRSRSRSSHILYPKSVQAAILHMCHSPHVQNPFKLPFSIFCGPHIPEEFSETSGRNYTNLNELSWKPDLLPDHLKWQQSNSECLAQMMVERERTNEHQLPKCISCNVQPEWCYS